MKKGLYIWAVFLLLGCAKENRWDCFKSSGDEVTENRGLSAFNSIYVEDRIDVIFKVDSVYRAEVKFGENIIHHIETDVSDGSLSISNNATCNWVRDLSKRPEVTIYAPEISQLENRCSGDITFADTLKTESFAYDQWECNGNAKLLIISNFTRITMHVGHCDVSVSGQTESAEFYSAAVGRLRARNFISPVTLSNNSSIQDMELYASGYLYAEINESGSILYSGEPETVDIEINGEGSVEPL